MKYVKMLGLLAVAAAALMAFAGTASATITSPEGTPYDGPMSATSSNTSLDGSVDIACSSSTVSGEVNNGETEGEITTLDFTECGNDTVKVVANGKLTILEKKVYSKSTVVTVTLHRTIFGFPITTHCEYATPVTKTHVGNLTGPNTISLIGAVIPQKPTDSACGANAEWTGSYTINTPEAGIYSD